MITCWTSQTCFRFWTKPLRSSNCDLIFVFTDKSISWHSCNCFKEMLQLSSELHLSVVPMFFKWLPLKLTRVFYPLTWVTRRNSPRMKPRLRLFLCCHQTDGTAFLTPPCLPLHFLTSFLTLSPSSCENLPIMHRKEFAPIMNTALLN